MMDAGSGFASCHGVHDRSRLASLTMAGAKTSAHDLIEQ